MIEIYIIVFLTFLTVTLLIMGANKLFSEYLTRRRLKNVTNKNVIKRKVQINTGQNATSNIRNLVGKLYNLSLPSGNWQDSTQKIKFLRAGYRDPSVPRIFYSAKSLLFFVLPLLFCFPVIFLLRGKNFIVVTFFLLVIAAVGYYLPDIYLSRRAKRRMTEMQENLADFIDLLVMCVTSGLGLDAALNRVSVEMVKSSPILSEEFYLTCLEIRAGASRITALKNLALRANIDDLQNLVSTLVQADKFGTSLSGAMKVQSEFMRLKRFQRAEEIAAKIPVKMLLPLGLFIFPILLFVLVGPALIQISESFSK